MAVGKRLPAPSLARWGVAPNKGMGEATTADFDGNGLPDVYVSNVHHKIQAEGGLLWLNDG